MSVTLPPTPGQAALLRTVALLALTLTLSLAPARAETHAHLQSVNPDGTSAWSGSVPFTLRGVLLCGPDEMLDPTPQFLPWNGGANQGQMGGQWQVVLQAVDPGDQGGTTCWMGQNYGNQPWIRNEDFSYSNETWVSEILRLNFDPSLLHPFQAGDLVEVTVRQALFYGGKRNINEGHDIDPAYNFEIRLLTAHHGLPTPEDLTLADVMEPGGFPDDPTSWRPIFDPTRVTGGERWQGVRVRLRDLTLLSTDGWTPTNAWANRLSAATDNLGRFISLRHPRYHLGPPPSHTFDAIGIFNQESGSGTHGTNGYELFVQQVLPHTPPPALDARLQLAVSWPTNGALYQLEWRGQADTGDWQPVTNTAAIIHDRHTVLLPPQSPQQFYRLRTTY
ncbi:MAG: hypothetical protein KJ072_15230 [Verrucomicrobia bacterium]|nr:hypothetical protein [Verrucomicrobiota bacterium]